MNELKPESERKFRSPHLTEGFEDLMPMYDIDRCVFLRKSLRIPLRVISNMTGISVQTLSLCENHKIDFPRRLAILYTLALTKIIEYDNERAF